MTMLFAAVHESLLGTKRRAKRTRRRQRFWLLMINRSSPAFPMPEALGSIRQSSFLQSPRPFVGVHGSAKGCHIHKIRDVY